MCYESCIQIVVIAYYNIAELCFNVKIYRTKDKYLVSAIFSKLASAERI